MGYIKSNLMNNEEVVYMAKVHWFIFVPGITMLILSFFMMSDNFRGENYAPFAFIILFIGGLYSLIKAFFIKISTELAITTKRVIAKTGFISRDSVELNHKKVESFAVDQSIFGRIFDFGNLTVQGTGGGKTPIPNIDNPMKFRQEAMDIIDRVEND